MKTHMKWLVPRLIADTLAMTLMGAASSQDILTYSGTDQQVKLVVNARKEGKLRSIPPWPSTSCCDR